MNKKLLYVLLTLVAVGSIGGYLYLNRCDEPDRKVTFIHQLRCAQAIAQDQASFKEELCQQQHGASDCELSNEDREIGYKLFVNKINTCAKASLEKDNLCTDKYVDVE